MPVVVPSAPEVQETTRMLEDSESVSSWGPQLSQDDPRGLLACFWLTVLFCELRSLPPIVVKPFIHPLGRCPWGIPTFCGNMLCIWFDFIPTRIGLKVPYRPITGSHAHLSVLSPLLGPFSLWTTHVPSPLSSTLCLYWGGYWKRKYLRLFSNPSKHICISRYGVLERECLSPEMPGHTDCIDLVEI